jgi:hypothetical protein
MVHSVVQNQEHVGEADHENTLYNWHVCFGHQHSVVQNQEHVGEAVHEDTLYNWHMRFGHQSHDAIEALGRQTRIGHQTHRQRATELHDLR